MKKQSGQILRLRFSHRLRSHRQRGAAATERYSRQHHGGARSFLPRAQTKWWLAIRHLRREDLHLNAVLQSTTISTVPSPHAREPSSFQTIRWLERIAHLLLADGPLSDARSAFERASPRGRSSSIRRLHRETGRTG
jgi:hypothetical protein